MKKVARAYFQALLKAKKKAKAATGEKAVYELIEKTAEDFAMYMLGKGEDNIVIMCATRLESERVSELRATRGNPDAAGSPVQGTAGPLAGKAP